MLARWVLRLARLHWLGRRPRNQHVDGQGFVAISLSGWQLTADGRALVSGSTYSLAAGQFQVIDNQLYVLESLITSDDMTAFDAGMMLTASAGAGALTIGTLAFAMGAAATRGRSPPPKHKARR